MKLLAKKYTILFVPFNHEKVVRFHVSQRLLLACIFALVLLLSLTTLALISNKNVWTSKLQEKNNSHIKNTLNLFSEKMNNNKKNFTFARKNIISFIKTYYPPFEKRFTLPKKLDSVQELNFLITKLNQFSRFRAQISHFFKEIPSIFPVLGGGMVNSPFGTRRDPFTGAFAFHTGVDIFKLPNVPIRATANGVVRLSQFNPSYGFMAIIDHKYGFATVYAHMISMPIVQDGDKVTQGQIIGYVGTSGRSVGYHLHYEVRNSHKYLNPKYYLFLKNGFE